MVFLKACSYFRKEIASILHEIQALFMQVTEDLNGVTVNDDERVLESRESNT